MSLHSKSKNDRHYYPHIADLEIESQVKNLSKRSWMVAKRWSLKILGCRGIDSLHAADHPCKFTNCERKIYRYIGEILNSEQRTTLGGIIWHHVALEAIQRGDITCEIFLPKMFNQSSKPHFRLEEIEKLRRWLNTTTRKQKAVLWKIRKDNCFWLRQKYH